ncbi:MAG: sulfite exporter TauE/SafE family protein [Pseudomonadota bacterium]
MGAVDPGLIALVSGVFLLAGTVKGVVGLGLPTVSIALLTFALGPDPAVVLMLLPSLVTNVWQAAVGGHFRALLRELRFFFAGTAATLWFGVLWRSTFAPDTLTLVIGGLVAFYALVGLATPQWPVPRARTTRWSHPIMGLVSGVMTGLSGLFILPGVMYIQALQLGRDRQVQCQGMMFTLTTVGLLLAFGSRGVATPTLLGLSAFGVLPAACGLWLGGRLRRRLSETQFRRAVLIALLLLGTYIVVRTGVGGV